jgi:RimJ/RimL family protein N-acetyltransferase
MAAPVRIPFESSPASDVGQPARTRRATWHHPVPRLHNAAVTLREISVRDASALLAHLDDPVALRHVAPCPATIEGLRRFARWARETRLDDRLICFAIIPARHTRPVGLMQLWPLDPGGTTAEWGVVIGPSFWGTGLFPAAASLLFQFVFDGLGVVRLEARTATANQRANAALRKIGGQAEGRLRYSLNSSCEKSDTFLWAFPAVTARAAVREAWSDARRAR